LGAFSKEGCGGSQFFTHSETVRKQVTLGASDISWQNALKRFHWQAVSRIDSHVKNITCAEHSNTGPETGSHCER
jgi:hypothetical protein